MRLTTNSKTIIRFSFSIFVGVLVVGYSIFSARHIIKGPTIVLESPQNGELTKTNFVEIRGKSSNLNYISLNDRQIFIDDAGNFKEKLLLYKGENTLKLYGKDKFGREITQFVQVVAPEEEVSIFTMKELPEEKTASSSKSL